jgi:hypothetical protein
MIIEEDRLCMIVLIPRETTDRSTRLARWLSDRLFYMEKDGCIGNETQRAECRLLYHWHWKHDIGPAHARALDPYLPPDLARLIVDLLAEEDVYDDDDDEEDDEDKNTMRLVGAGRLLTQNNGHPLEESEWTLLRAMHRHRLMQLQSRARLILTRICDRHACITALDVFRVLELVCENLEPFGLDDDQPTAMIVWSWMVQCLHDVIKCVQPYFATFTHDRRTLWNMQSTACFARISVRFHSCISLSEIDAVSKMWIIQA